METWSLFWHKLIRRIQRTLQQAARRTVENKTALCRFSVVRAGSRPRASYGRGDYEALLLAHLTSGVH